MSPEELLKKAESLAKQLADAKKVLDTASDAGKKIAQAKVDKLEAGIKAMGKKAAPAMQKLKKAGEEGAAVASFWSNPIGSIFNPNGLKNVTSAASSIYGAMKKGYDFSRSMDGKLMEGLKQVGKYATDPVGLAKDMIKGSDFAAEAKKKKDAEVRAKKDQQSAKLPGGATEIKIQQGAKKGTYASAKKKDPNLDSYIAQRKKLKKGSPEYNKIQGKINAAYGVGGRSVSPKKAETKAVTKVETKTPKAELAGATKKPAIKKPETKKPVATGAKAGSGGRDAAKMFEEEVKSSAPISKKKEASRREKRLQARLNRLKGRK